MRAGGNNTGCADARNEPNRCGEVAPQSVELEEAVLGALMLEKEALSAVIDVLKPEVFYVPKNQRVYEAIQRLFEQSKPVDLLTVTIGSPGLPSQ